VLLLRTSIILLCYSKGVLFLFVWIFVCLDCSVVGLLDCWVGWFVVRLLEGV